MNIINLGGILKGRELASFIAKIIKDKKGRDIQIVNIRNIAVFTDYFVVSTVEVAEHGEAVMEEIWKKLKFENNLIPFVEQDKTSDWIVLDYGDVMVHIMTEEKREFYRIEELWSNEDKSAAK
ncbi:MAG: ribosome silencing factor [Caldiserica bacterium CG02_land_8_20_14_3_00_36_38]|nr:MAG: ribosome silencing factor [Caldiserica bacterium CG02_land_8_20_14_3_00_36_38]PIX29721.1 MAG: ribosome silencing factor [Caldiserica bacterium CG_4_8_14_3_um_filter_35_18]